MTAVWQSRASAIGGDVRLAATEPSKESVDAYYASLAPFWHPVRAAEDVHSEPIAVVLLGRPLVLARLDGEVRCFDNLCRHLGAALSQGDIVDGRHLRCRYHGWSYDSGGRCVDIPARRDSPVPSGAVVASYPVQVRYGIVWVCLAQEPRAELPAFPEYDEPSFRTVGLQVYDTWRASAPRLVMGALDDTHFPWVHPGLLGDPEHPEAPDHTAQREGDYVVARYSRIAPNDIAGGDPYMRVDRASYCSPNAIRLVKSMPHGTLVVFEAVCPMTYDQSIPFIHMARDYDLDPARDQWYIDFETEVQEQDRPVLENQRPWLLPPLSSRLLLYVRPADIPLVEYQKWLEELGVPQL